MKLTVESKLVKQVIADLRISQPVDIELCQSYVDDLTADMPSVNAESIEQADNVAKRVMEWHRRLPHKQTSTPVPQGRELAVAVGMLLAKIDELNFLTETMLFDLGVVERGETNT